MKIQLFLLTVLFVQIFTAPSLRVLEEDEEELVTLKGSMKINDEEVYQNGVIEYDDKYTCISNGTPANSALLEQAIVIEGKYCFPLVYATGYFERMNKYRKMLYFRLHSPAESGFMDTLKITYNLNNDVGSVKQCEKWFGKFTQAIIDCKASAKKALDSFVEKVNEYNKLTAKLLSGSKSISELQSEIDDLKDKIKENKAYLLEAQTDFNDLEVVCKERREALSEEIQKIQAFHNEAENLESDINDNKAAIADYKLALVNLAQAIKNEEKRREEAREILDPTYLKLKEVLPTSTEKIDSIESEVEPNRSKKNVDEICDSFVNVV